MSIVTDYNAQLALFAGSLEQAQDLGARAEAEAASRRAAEESRLAARSLRNRGLTFRDVGSIMGVSQRRAAQLLRG